MQLQKLVLSHFRSYTHQEIEFSPNVNCFQGLNAEGKTNLLEAIYVLSTGKSFRTHSLQDLIQNGASRFDLEATFVKEGISQTLTLSFDGKLRKITHYQTTYHSFLPLLGLLPCILLAPEDIAILSSSPSERRRFLDIHLAQTDPLYVRYLARYHKAMKQRNILLKNKEEKTLSPWEQIMAESALYLMQKRADLIEKLQKPAQSFVSTLSDLSEHLSIEYKPSLLPSLTQSGYMDQWEKSRKKEWILGSTNIGPHRDDLFFHLNQKEARVFCSEGQKRCCIAALRLAEWELFCEHFDSPPLLGIDDFGIHLDPKRSEKFASFLSRGGQVFLTAPTFSENIFPSAQIFQVHQGSVL